MVLFKKNIFRRDVSYLIEVFDIFFIWEKNMEEQFYDNEKIYCFFKQDFKYKFTNKM